MPLGSISAPPLRGIDRGGYYIKGIRPEKQRRPNAHLLTQFLRIAESANADKAAAAFTNRWGLLGLCEHGLPVIHSRQCGFPEDDASSYQKFALRLDALRRIGLQLNAGKLGEPLDWELAEESLFDDSRSAAIDQAAQEGTIAGAREYYAALIDRLVFLTQLAPRLRWDRPAKGWAIDFDSFAPSNLPALLTIQLMAQVGGKAMKKCLDCPRWFQPKGRQVYCDQCGIRAAWRAAARRKRSGPL